MLFRTVCVAYRGIVAVSVGFDRRKTGIDVVEHFGANEWVLLRLLGLILASIPRGEVEEKYVDR